MDSYALIDSGGGRKLEQIGPFRLIRPAAQAVYPPSHPNLWEKADATFTREGGNRWIGKLPKSWHCALGSLRFKIAPTEFGHLGLFAEHGQFWEWIQARSKNLDVLNLFAYSGGATLAAAQGGARVCHLDASIPMINWAKENAELNQLAKAPIRWIADDAMKFMAREKRRGRFYDAIICDPPSFGRGTKGEVFKIERDIVPILTACKELLSSNPRFFLLTCHTTEFSPLVLEHLFKQCMPHLKGTFKAGEIVIPSKEGLSLPCGTYLRWEND